MAWPLRRYFRLLWWTLCLLTFLALPLTIWEFQKQHYNVHYQAWFIGGIFVILSMPISIYEIAMHTEYYTQPRLQKHVIRILLMVPIYAVDAWFALRFKKAREYIDPIRECYEAFVIYSFFAYLMAFLQDSLGDLDEHMSHKPQMEHMWGVRWLLRPWDMGTRFLWECKKGVLNYVILRPVCTGLAFITDIFDKYGEGQINFRKSYVYLAAVTNFSQLWALYCLVMLYTAMHAELAPIRPLSKFICIKAVVFVTFWQGIAIAVLVYADVIPRDDSWTTYERLSAASGIQDFLICIEMFLAALAHAYAFPPRDYMAGHSKGFFSNVRYIFDLRDVVDDVGLVVEEHVSSATSAVVKVPQRAVKKAAQGLAKNTKKLFGTGGQRRLLDEEEEEASKCALLSPTTSPAGAAASGMGGGAGGGTPEGAGVRGGSGGSGSGGRRRRSSGGSVGGGEGALGGAPFGVSGYAREMLTAPHQHLMLQEMESAGALAASSGAGPLSALASTSSPAAAARGSLSTLPPLAPAAAALGTAAAAASGGSSGSAFNNLVTSALYHTRGGYGGASASAAGGGGEVSYGSAFTLRFGGGGGRMGSGGDDAGGGAYDELPSSSPAAAAGPSGSGGVELPLVAAGGGHSYQHSHQQQRQQLTHGSAGELESMGRRGSGGGSSSRSKGRGEVVVRMLRGGGGGSGGGGSSGGLSPGDDSPYERLPMLPVVKRAHDE